MLFYSFDAFIDVDQLKQLLKLTGLVGKSILELG